MAEVNVTPPRFWGGGRGGLLRYQCLHVGAIGLIVLYLWPYWVLGQDARVLVHDQLDSVFISFKLLAESGQLFAHPDATLSAMGHEIPRAAYPSPLYGVVWLFKALGAFEGYVSAQLGIRLVAYWGMYRLLSRHCMTSGEYRIPMALAALSFSCLPQYPLFGLSIAGQPLFFSALLSIRSGQGKATDWLVCALFPMWSLPALGGFFTLVAGGVLWLACCVARRSGVWRLLGALVLAAVATLIVEYQLVMIVLGLANGFVSHRTEFRIDTPVFGAAVLDAWNNFRNGQYHAPSLQSAVILPGALLALGLAVCGRDGVWWGSDAPCVGRSVGAAAASVATVILIVSIALLLRRPSWMSLLLLSGLVGLVLVGLPLVAWGQSRRRLFPWREDAAFQPIVLLLVSLVAAMVIAVWYAGWPLLWGVIATAIPQMPYINLSRLHYLHPLLWSLVLAGVLAVLWRQGRVVGPLLVLVVAALQASVLYKSSQPRQAEAAGDPSFRAFFSPVLFQNLARTLESRGPVSGVVSVGLHPAIAAYNGFRTLDGYLANYPLAYKRAFRGLISGELAQDEDYRRYFDEWGSRFYVFSHELASVGDAAFALSRYRVEEKGIRLDNLHFDTRAFVSLGGSHVLSAVAIGNAQALGLELVTVAEHPESPWRLFAYRVANLDR